MRLKTVSIIALTGSAVIVLVPLLFPLSGNSGPDLVTALGRFHILALHFPIALLLVVPLLEIAARFKGLEHLEKSTFMILLLAYLSGLKASILGYLLAAGEGITGTLLTQHMWGGIIATVLMAAALILKTARIQSAYWIVLFASIGALTVGSHHGASMVHGEKYLTEKLFPEKQKKVALTDSAYETLIRPIFQQHCYDCHSVAKEQGGYRMDDFERLLYGGDGGMPGIEPGNLEDSEVHYRITLKPDSNAFMPPEGRTPLSETEVALITWWVEAGAPPETSISELLKQHPSDWVRLEE